MILKNLLKDPLNWLLAVGICAIGHQLYTTLDFSDVRNDKHQRTPITKQVQNKKGKKYAILVSAYGEERFKKNIKFGYESFLHAGFLSENIYVLTGHEDVGDYVRGKATRKNLISTLNKIKTEISLNDVLFLYVTNHGGKKYLFFGESKIKLDGKDITVSDLWKEYKEINSNYSVAVFKQCQGGDFANRFGQNNSIGISAAKRGKDSWGDDHDNQNGFSIQLFEAIGGRKASGELVNPDLNNDNKVSIEEIFDYASNNNQQTKPRWHGIGKQTPQLYWQNANPKDLHIR